MWYYFPIKPCAYFLINFFVCLKLQESYVPIDVCSKRLQLNHLTRFLCDGDSLLSSLRYFLQFFTVRQHLDEETG